MLQTTDIRTIKSYDLNQTQSSINLIEIEDEISATFELMKILHQYNSQSGWTLLIAPD